MIRAFFLATALVAAALPAAAQETEKFCYTPAMIAADVAKVPNAKEIITLRSIDIGFAEPMDVVVYGDGKGNYLAAAFLDGCYWGNQIMNDDTVAAFIDSHTKRAEPL